MREPEAPSEPVARRPRILLVEDDRRLGDLIEEYLGENGYEVLRESHGGRAVARVPGERPDLVLLDVGLPDLDGFEVCRRVRPGYRGPILMLTARSDEIDEVVGLEVGADDYIAKPVRPRALLARIRTWLRRERAGDGAAPTRIRVGRLEIDASRRTLELEGRPIELTSAEFELVWYLAQRQGQVVSREEIFKELLEIEYDGIDRTIDLRVWRIRKKLDDASQRIIKSVRGAGYILVDDS